jgi:hypothetical protein
MQDAFAETTMCKDAERQVKTGEDKSVKIFASESLLCVLGSEPNNAAGAASFIPGCRLGLREAVPGKAWPRRARNPPGRMMSGRLPGQAPSTVTRSARSGVAHHQCHQQIFHRRSIWNRRLTMLEGRCTRIVLLPPFLTLTKAAAGSAAHCNLACGATIGWTQLQWGNVERKHRCFRHHLTRSVPLRTVAKRNQKPALRPIKGAVGAHCRLVVVS